MSDKYCFMNAQRPCDLTCKAAFEVDDPEDNIDCYFVWLAYHFGEGIYEMKRVLEGVGPAGGGFPLGGPSGSGEKPGPPSSSGPKMPKGFPSNN
jgi:hypothetical protein